MSVRIEIPDNVFPGFYWKGKKWTFGLWAHSLQMDQIWIFLIRRNRRRFGYRTRGQATSKYLTYKDGGFHWPWQKRSVSGRG